jgi:DNA-binding protein H-NS
MSSYEELIAQRDALDRQIEAARRDAQATAIATIKGLVSQFGLTAEDCGFKSTKLAVKTKQVVAAKYRGPNGETWTGRGRPPGWLSTLESQGANREVYRIGVARD